MMHKNITTSYVQRGVRRMDTKLFGIRRGNIGNRSLKLSGLTEREFMVEITRTRTMFENKFPELSNVIFEYNKQCALLELDFWYQKPLPKRCERFFEIEVMSLLDNVDEDSEHGKIISQYCMSLLIEYLPHKYLPDA